jgi:hypothetical protein
MTKLMEKPLITFMKSVMLIKMVMSIPVNSGIVLSNLKTSQENKNVVLIMVIFIVQILNVHVIVPKRKVVKISN